MTPRRWYVPVVLATLAAGGLAFFASSRTWASATVRADGLPSDAVSVSGTDAQPLVAALALVVVTGVLAVLAASHRVRRVVGALLLVVGLAAAVVVATSGGAVDDAMASAVRGSTAFTGDNVPETQHAPVWPVLAGLCFVASALLGGVVTWFGARWPTMGRRFEAPSVGAERSTEPSDLWSALDEGRDPTE